jgi:rhodanese-related sulfurtransferase
MTKPITALLTTLLLMGCTPQSYPQQEVRETTIETYREPQPTQQVVPSNYSVDASEAHKMIQEEPNIFILDVRTPQEIPIDGKIANSVMIPLQVLGQYLYQLDKSQKILVYCHTGNRSLVAMQILSDNGFTVVDMAGGISSWSAYGFPVER